MPVRMKRKRKLKVDQMCDNSKDTNAEKKCSGLSYNCAQLIVNDNVTTVSKKQEVGIMGG